MLRRLVPVVVGALVLLGGCSEEKDSSAGSSSSSSTTAESTTTTIAAVSPTTAAPGTLSEASPLWFDGIGPIKVGMTVDEATKAVGKPITPEANSPSDLCNFAKVQGGPAGLAFMLERAKTTDPWHVARVDVTRSSRIASFTGVRIGDTEADVEKSWNVPTGGRVEKTPHKYVEGGHDITFDEDGPTGNLMLFETDGTKVTQFRSGQQEPVGYVEGCA